MGAAPAISTRNKALFYSFGLVSIVCILLSFYLEQKALLVLPFVAIVALIGLVNFRALFFILLACIPLSVEFSVTESLGTDLPTEPLMIGLMLVLIVFCIKHVHRLDFSFFSNSIGILLVVHLFWIFLTTTTSLVPLFSVKFLLAKMWYIAAFFIAPAIIIKSSNDMKRMFWVVYLPLSFTVILALVRHAMIDFSFDDVNSILTPFYRNHVGYAAILVTFIPFIFYARQWYVEGSWIRRLLNISVLVYAVAVYFSYTRACYLALVAMVGAYFVFRFRATKIAIFAVIMLVAGVIGFIVQENYYLKYSPTTKTVSQHEFTDLIDATFKAEDVSSMERIYRWIAAVHMANDRPITGFGPNGFVSNYKNYTVFIFETWISENEEQSGVHNYFLMMLVEQGIVGLLLFVGLLIAIFTYGTKQYHQMKDSFSKSWMMASLLSMIAITVNLVFSDMIEVDKTGSFFFLNMAIMILLARNYKGFVVPEVNVEIKTNYN